ncbi:MAG TPA: glycosyltransferase [Phenylobacterium sp.]|uniref:glycosyltransferase family 2 protein n=1 Tax=Phenylobacterium sp. TaxID=1871053 RepID=UPI002B4976EC|nr:glycosyltransferase [Phenylobacterium sp.]HKR88913.1 glycosyltransferase [Phenylobacterium sp.]
MGDVVRIDVGVCTYQRESVAETLASLGAQQLPPDVRLHVIVADNEPTPAAEARVRTAAAIHRLDLAYVHAPARNISLARNAVLDAVRGDYLALIDDDQVAAPDWIASLLAAARAQDCAAVLGPVTAVYPPQTPRWIASGDFHSFRPVRVGGRILKGYSCNVLIRMDIVRRAGLRFDLSLGRMGGEDDDFFYRLTDAGGVIGEAPAARVFEPVPASRAKLGWLLRRAFRSGQSHGRRQLRRALPGRLIQLVLASIKSAACFVGAAVMALFPVSGRRWLVRGALHAGAVARLAGIKELELY